MNLTQFYDLPEVKKLLREYTKSPNHFMSNGIAISFMELITRLVLETGMENMSLPEDVSIDTYNAAVATIHAIDRTAFKLHYRLGVDHG